MPDSFDNSTNNIRSNNFGYVQDVAGKPSEIDYDKVRYKYHGRFRPKFDILFTRLNFHALYCTTLLQMITVIEIFLSSFLILLSIYLVRLLLNLISTALCFIIETS